jgi:quinohemoprotein ethanol dehydrogenase
MLLGSLAAKHGWVGREHLPRLLAFALDGKAGLPPSPAPSRPVPVDAPEFQLDTTRIQRGLAVYAAIGKCNLCHGLGAVAGGFAPDLRASAIPLAAPAFDAVVRGGSLASRGMPRFADLSAEDLEDLRHYLRSRARESLAVSSAMTP